MPQTETRTDCLATVLVLPARPGPCDADSGVRYGVLPCVALLGPGPCADPVRVHPGQSFNSGRFANSASASGLSSASVLPTVRPSTVSRTANSVILPLRVRGIAPTCRIFAGTWRGLVRVLEARADPLTQRVVQRQAVGQYDEQHDADVVLPALADRDALADLRQLLDLAVDLGRADAHAAGIEHRVGTAVDQTALARSGIAQSPWVQTPGKRAK